MKLFGELRRTERLLSSIALVFFIFSIVLVVGYQLYIVLHTTASTPFLEPDNFEYLLFAKLAVIHNTFNVSNPYLVYPLHGFFEQSGLFETPVLLHNILPFVQLVWDMRIIYTVLIILVYLFAVLIVRQVLSNTTLNNSYRRFAYGLTLINFVLMQQTQIIEWRGSLFIVVFQLGILWLLSYIYTNKGITYKKKVLLLISILVMLILSWYMWSGWIVNAIIFIGLVVSFEFYKRLNETQRRLFFKILAFILIVIPLMLILTPYLFNDIWTFIGIMFQPFLNSIHQSFPNCNYNPLNISEVGCLTVNNGLLDVALDGFFGAFAVLVFLYDKTFSLNKNKYEYLLLGCIVLYVLQLPLAANYVRLVQDISPVLAAFFSIGLVGTFVRAGSRRWVNVIVMVIIFISSTFGFLLYASSVENLYQLDTPIGLVNVSNYLFSHATPNSTVLTFYGYGDKLEYTSHVRVYVDTIQELNYMNITKIDRVFNANTIIFCEGITKIQPTPSYILVSPEMLNYTIYANASNKSIIREPYLYNNTCGYTLIYNNSDFYLFENKR